MQTVLIPLIDGFEEIEAITCIDILRRAGLAVTTAGIGKPSATGSHRVAVQTDSTFDLEKDKQFDLVLLPGGPGTVALGEVAGLTDLLQRHAAAGKSLAAICAAPTILAAAGLLEGKRATCFPAVEGQMRGARIFQDRVVLDGRIMTSRGAGTAVPFALAVVELLLGPQKSREIAGEIIYE